MVTLTSDGEALEHVSSGAGATRTRIDAAVVGEYPDRS
jgi:hypothetical protein